MNRHRSSLCHAILVAAFFISWGLGTAAVAGAPRVRALRVQKVGDTTYFDVSIDPPREMRWPRIVPDSVAPGFSKDHLVLLPSLVAQDGKTAQVYPFLTFSYSQFEMRGRSLKFVGKLIGKGKADFILTYPTTKAAGEQRKDQSNSKKSRQPDWKVVPVTLNFDRAKPLARYKTPKRRENKLPEKNDLEGRWAVSQAARFAVLEAQSPDFSFYTFARQATCRKYGVRVPALVPEQAEVRKRAHQRLYEMTTGASAIAESLQLERMLSSNFRDDGERTIDIREVSGIDIEEHPWEEMMGTKKPSPEPLAKLVPHDNFYVHFKNISKFIEFGELLDQWGTNLVRAYELNSRDYDLKKRYEKQLCLGSSKLAKTLGPLVVRSLAITGSDGYVREGTDVTALFHVADKKLFLAAVEPYLQAARKEFGDQLEERRRTYHKITLESFVTPLREVSLHRASFRDFVIYSNSATGLRRVIDTFQGRHKALADSLDFQYMPTVFRLQDKEEDGFAFLPDAFIRNLVGPANKIKEKRRLEALTSLTMATNGALFSAWETGKLPANHRDMLATSKLQQKEIYVPDGRKIVWDATQGKAVSEVYNTLHFATPLIELPIDDITPTEKADYERFREGYLRNWRQYFDPIGMRFSLTGKKVQVETYILPLINNSSYNGLRGFTGSGTTKFKSSTIPPKTFAQFLAHISPDLRGRVKWLGDWFVVRLGDSSITTKLMEVWIYHQRHPELRDRFWPEMERLFYQLPVTAGIGIRDAKSFARDLEQLQAITEAYLGAQRQELKPAYKGVVITRVQFDPNQVRNIRNWLRKSARLIARQNPNAPNLEGLTYLLAPTYYYALIENGWYVSFAEAPLKELIDHAVARRKGKKGVAKEKASSVNSSLYAAPNAGIHTGAALRSYLEWESHRRAQGNLQTWYLLHHTGLIKPEMPEGKKRAAALQYLGFVPVSPDGAEYVYDPKRDEVSNRRHGSLRQPSLASTLAKDSPLGQLLDQIRALRVNLRFREDGIHTILTLERTMQK